MESLITFINVLAIAGFAVSVFMIFMYIYADHSLNHTPGGEIRQTLANMKGTQLVVKPVGKYVIILVISGAWLIAQWWV
jgi:hypothetical protein